ncbi:hypothetical protein [Lentzea sp.]|uniref:hypothetical protein n=1 Tax=Lentzea sp. TaxID=56099 RepID=UPI002ED37307
MTTSQSTPRGDPRRSPSPTEHLAAGAVVTCFDPSPSTDRPFRRGVAVGPEIADPRTRRLWIPLIWPDLAVDLVDLALVVDIAPVR